MDSCIAVDLAAVKLIYTLLTHTCQSTPPPLLLSLCPSSSGLKTEQKLPIEVNKLLPSIAVVEE